MYMCMCMHPTYYKYCDYWIIGKTLEQVEEKYGQFDLDIVEPQRFRDEQECFDEIVKYYKSLDYVELLAGCDEVIVIDNIKYKVFSA